MNDNVNTSYGHQIIYMQMNLQQNVQFPYYFKCLDPSNSDRRICNLFGIVVVMLLIAAFGWNRF